MNARQTLNIFVEQGTVDATVVDDILQEVASTGKTLCDAIGDFPKALAEELLRNGLIRGLVSLQVRNDWPQNVWSVHDGVAFEAQLENGTIGTYHGYPMPVDDVFCLNVLENWKAREPTTDH